MNFNYITHPLKFDQYHQDPLYFSENYDRVVVKIEKGSSSLKWEDPIFMQFEKTMENLMVNDLGKIEGQSKKTIRKYSSKEVQKNINFLKEFTYWLLCNYLNQNQSHAVQGFSNSNEVMIAQGYGFFIDPKEKDYGFSIWGVDKQGAKILQLFDEVLKALEQSEQISQIPNKKLRDQSLTVYADTARKLSQLFNHRDICGPLIRLKLGDAINSALHVLASKSKKKVDLT